MAYHALESSDTEADAITLRQRSSMSSVYVNASNFKANGNTDDDGMTCASQSCYLHQERQLATPTIFRAASIDGFEWMQDFEEIARANNWSPKAKLDIVPIYLKTKSDKTWFRENRHEWGDFDSFRLAFVERFGKDSSGQRLSEEVNTEVRNENLMSWLFSFFGLVVVLSPIWITITLVVLNR
ncbi:hypothetical protein BGZ96_011077 [Linnemannia gamsii]|uniref:Uncharacterized protein n=1 Tax=Linnemannia gamsii TaxID=64522 RepID=A0ABQ7JSX5_9FUNG|nr:hypothetical protein BGZ96_011077 [Linnemannia gamsii]